MSTHWRWASISEDIKLTLTLDSDDPELILKVELSAKANGITIYRIDPGEAVGVREPRRPLPEDDEGWPTPAPLPEDYWESAE